MKIRRYTCKDMQEALLKVKMDLGSEAVIMNSRKVKQKGFAGLFSKPMIEVVAAIDDDYVRPRSNPYHQRQASPNTTFQQQPQQSVGMREVPQPIMKEQKSVMSEYIEPEHKIAVSQIGESSNPQENHKITDLENKVKSMESMMKQIYRAVQGKEDSKKEVSLTQETIPPSISIQKPAPIAPALDCESLSTLREILSEHDVEPKLIEKITDKIKERGGQALKQEEVFSLAARVITVLLGESEPLMLNENKKPHVAIFIGSTGVGKTTTLAKIAADFTLNRKKKVGLITADTYRISAVEQLKTYAEILNIPVNVVYSPSEIKDAVARLSDNDLILIDTAGRSHKNKAHFDELKTLISAVNADETYLVMSCNISRAAIREILEYHAFIKNYKLLFTKLDESPGLGVILNARYMTGKPLSYTTAGQSVPDDLDVANVKQLVTSILGKGDI